MKQEVIFSHRGKVYHPIVGETDARGRVTATCGMNFEIPSKKHHVGTVDEARAHGKTLCERCKTKMPKGARAAKRRPSRVRIVDSPLEKYVWKKKSRHYHEIKNREGGKVRTICNRTFDWKMSEIEVGNNAPDLLGCIGCFGTKKDDPMALAPGMRKIASEIGGHGEPGPKSRSQERRLAAQKGHRNVDAEAQVTNYCEHHVFRAITDPRDELWILVCTRCGHANVKQKADGSQRLNKGDVIEDTCRVSISCGDVVVKTIKVYFKDGRVAAYDVSGRDDAEATSIQREHADAICQRGFRYDQRRNNVQEPPCNLRKIVLCDVPSGKYRVRWENL